jgi:hypothetical protein
MDRRTLILTTVGGHILLTVLHALVHVAIPVIPDGGIAAFATVSLYVLPVAGAGLAVSDYRRVGGAALFTAGIASFVFEGSFHFVISNPDHVAQVADHTLFGVTAILTTVGNLLLIVAAWFSIRTRR